MLVQLVQAMVQFMYRGACVTSMLCSLYFKATEAKSPLSQSMNMASSTQIISESLVNKVGSLNELAVIGYNS